jgi:polyisoprenoid-binding protein YceI
MLISLGRYVFGPQNGTLSVRTGRAGAAAKAGHNLLIEVGSWEATLEVAADGGQTELEFTADAGSLRVLDGTGGVQALGDDDKIGIKQTIDEDVLRGSPIRFRSSRVEAGPGAGRMSVQGELELAGKRGPIEFELLVSDDRRLSGSASVKQTDWGIKPHSALFGALKVADHVEVVIDAGIPAN